MIRGNWKGTCSWLALAMTLLVMMPPRVSLAAGQGAVGGATTDPKRITFEHDGQGVSGYVLYLDPDAGSTLRIDLGALKPVSGNVVSAPLPPLPAGTYHIEIAAYNAGGESPRVPANPPSFTVTAKMSAPASTMSHQMPTPTPVEHEAAAPPPKDERRVEQPKSSTSDSSAKKPGTGRRLWRVLVGGDE